MPWDLDRLTYDEFSDAIAYIDESARKMREGSKAGVSHVR
jgi:hypothetical protein